MTKLYREPRTQWEALVDAALARERERIPGPPEMSPEEEADHIRRIVAVRAARAEGEG